MGGRYYSPNRVPSQRRRAGAAEADYRGTDVYLSLVDAAHAPYRHDLNRLEVSARCTNRDLPLYLSRSGGEVELRWEQGGVVSHVRCLSGVTPPRPSPATGPYAWRLVNYLTLNYLSIGDRGNGGTGGGTDGAAGLRDLLSLYARAGDPRAADEVNAILSVRSKPFTCRVPPTGANDWEVAFARGVEVQVELAERAFADGWAYLLGSVLNQFFARYVSVNSMVRVVVGGTWNHKRTEIRWSANTGRASSF
ncbi:type VI secretion system baseplate subunit TssF [Sphingomonas sp.]|uniref:type VI secretion system baseplate subunit TssF n=1 Tax=Sphingomonas sp. TaxID=28214 RepID=UPI003B0014F1